MSISKEITRLEHSAVKLTLTVGKDQVRSQYDDLIKDYVKSAAIPGFRKGKVPRDVLERKFGTALKEEALSKILNKVIEETFADESFPKEDHPLPYSTPRLDEENELLLELDNDLVFSVVYDVLPQLVVGNWKGLELEVPDVKVEDEDISRELEAIRERNAIVLDKDDDAAAAKDHVVTVNYCELEEGKEIPGTERQDFVFTLGTGYNLYQFDDDIIGMKKGETKDIAKSFPEDYAQKELAGKNIKLRVTLTALKEKKLPELDDELAQDVDEKFNTLEDLKTSIRERLEQNLQKRLKDITIGKILDKVLETTPIDLPQSMVNLELDARLRNVARRYNTDPEDLLKIMAQMGQDPEQIRLGWKDDAEKALKSRLIVETLIRDMKLEASDEEINMEIEKRCAETDSPNEAEQIKKYYEQENALDYLGEEIKEVKLFDLFEAENKVKIGKKESYLDIMSNKW